MCVCSSGQPDGKTKQQTQLVFLNSLLPGDTETLFHRVALPCGVILWPLALLLLRFVMFSGHLRVMVQ